MSEAITEVTHDSTPKTNPSIRDGCVVLTPEHFRELDYVSRTIGGAVLVVKPHEEMEGAYARQSVLAGSVYRDSRIRTGVCMEECGTIQIANRIKINKDAMRSFEVVWKDIPLEELYWWVIHHEIGHRLGNFSWWDLIEACRENDRAFTTEVNREMAFLNEILADRWAWEKLHPEMPLETKPEYDERIDAFKEQCPLSWRTSTKSPMPTEECEFVPTEHVERGIPWASTVEVA